MIFPLCKWCFDLSWYKFEKRWADVFQIYPNAIHLNPLQFCPSMPLLGFPVFCLSSSMVLSGYFHILVNSMTIWSVLKLPKIAWPSPFKQLWHSSRFESRSGLKFFQALISQLLSCVHTCDDQSYLYIIPRRSNHMKYLSGCVGSSIPACLSNCFFPRHWIGSEHIGWTRVVEIHSMIMTRLVTRLGDMWPSLVFPLPTSFPMSFFR